MSERPEPWIWHFLKTMPSTNVRIASTILLVMGTFALMAVSVIVLIIKGGGGENWNPSIEWLGFLGVLGGLDLMQFGTKRTTDSAYVAAKVSGEPPKDPPPEPKPPEIGA
jgi:hypothetical protein